MKRREAVGSEQIDGDAGRQVFLIADACPRATAMWSRECVRSGRSGSARSRRCGVANNARFPNMDIHHMAAVCGSDSIPVGKGAGYTVSRAWLRR